MGLWMETKKVFLGIFVTFCYFLKTNVERHDSFFWNFKLPEKFLLIGVKLVLVFLLPATSPNLITVAPSEKSRPYGSAVGHICRFSCSHLLPFCHGCICPWTTSVIFQLTPEQLSHLLVFVCCCCCCCV